MTFWNLLSAASVLVALATFVGLALQRGVLTSVREQNGDYEKRIKFLEDQRDRDKQTIKDQTNDIASLQRIVTGEVQWQAISDLLEHHHKDAVQHWTRAEELLVGIRDSQLGRST